MDSILRAAAIYFFLLLVFRIAGKRAVSQITTFDFILLLIIGEAIQQGLVGEDFSLIHAFLVVVTLVGIDIALAYVKDRSPALDKILDDVPLVVVEHGKLLHERMQKAGVDENDILVAARELQGLERLDQIKYAVLERSGGISIIPTESKG